MARRRGARQYDRVVRPNSVAQLYCGLGENDDAIEWLERAYEEHDDWLSWAKIDPLLDPLRPDPRFRDLLRRVHLET